jgi:hypothetical protein
MLPQIALHDPVFRADFFISDFPRNSRRGAQFSAFRFGRRSSVDFREVLIIDSHRGNRFIVAGVIVVIGGQLGIFRLA